MAWRYGVQCCAAAAPFSAQNSHGCRKRRCACAHVQGLDATGEFAALFGPDGSDALPRDVFVSFLVSQIKRLPEEQALGLFSLPYNSQSQRHGGRHRSPEP